MSPPPVTLSVSSQASPSAPAGSFACHICGATAQPLDRYSEFSRVRSDCLPWHAGGVLGICGGCGAAVVRTDAVWQAECDAIYTSYRIYHQSGGVEQVVAQASAAEPVGRSQALLRHVGELLRLPQQGRLLDVGCGNGGFLKTFCRMYPGWSAVGSEFDAKHRTQVEGIAGVEKLHAGPLEEITGKFDLISIIHVLEHIQKPVDLLRTLRGMLRPGGSLLIQLPYYVLNPVELLVADHATHFSAPSLRRLLASAGWKSREMNSEWIAKELSCVADVAEGPSDLAAEVDPEDFRLPLVAMDWIETFRKTARDAAADAKVRGSAFGILGTAIVGVWLAAELEGLVQFFVDEDPARVGKSLEGIPVVAPGAIPAHATVFMGVSAIIAESIAHRIRREDILVVPPPANPC